MTHKVVRALVMATILFLGTTTAWAQAALGSRTSIDVAGATPQDVLTSLAKTLNCTLDVQTELEGPVTLKVSNITVRTALTVVCEMLGCRWTIGNGTLRIMAARAEVRRTLTRRKAPVLLEKLERNTGSDQRFEKTPVRDVLAALSKVAEMEITTDEPLASKTITADLSNRPINAALREILNQAGAKFGSYLAIKDGDSVRLKIVAKVPKSPAKAIRYRQQTPRAPHPARQDAVRRP